MGQFLEETIESVIRNLGPGDEYYVIDGGSTDSSVDIIRKYESYITGWISEPDRGYADALCKGFELSVAPLMCWINSGDLLLPGALDIVRKEFRNSDCDLFFCDDYYIDEQGKVLQLSKGYVKDLKSMMLYGGWTPLQDACFWRREIYIASGGIDASVRLAADFDLFLKMSTQGKTSYLPTVMSAFRQHDSQKSIANAEAYAKERKQVVRRALSSENCGYIRRVLSIAFYGVLVRIRCRLNFLNRRKTKHLGADIKQLKAEFVLS